VVLPRLHRCLVARLGAVGGAPGAGQLCLGCAAVLEAPLGSREVETGTVESSPGLLDIELGNRRVSPYEDRAGLDILSEIKGRFENDSLSLCDDLHLLAAANGSRRFDRLKECSSGRLEGLHRKRLGLTSGLLGPVAGGCALTVGPAAATR
jgi:hypothetical protein